MAGCQSGPKKTRMHGCQRRYLVLLEHYHRQGDPHAPSHYCKAEVFFSLGVSTSSSLSDRATSSAVSHQADPTLQCHVCALSFSTNFNLKRHLKTKHDDSFEGHRCHICQISYTTQSYLDKHNRTKHNVAQYGGSFVHKNSEESKKANSQAFSNGGAQKLYEQRFSAIKTYFKCQKIQDIFNFRLVEQTIPLKTTIRALWDEKVQSQVKVQCSFGFILRHRLENRFRYFHSSQNNTGIFEHVKTIKTREEMLELCEYIESIDWTAKVMKARPDSSWVLERITNLTFFFTKLPFVKFGAARRVPLYLKKNKSLMTLEGLNGKRYKDNMCFFRALALCMFCTCKKRCSCLQSIEPKVSSLYHKYQCHVDSHIGPKKFPGVSMSMLSELEDIFEVSINVFSLDENGKAKIIRSSIKKHHQVLNLNAYKRHLCFIKHLDLYAKAYECKNCLGLFPSKSRLNFHQKATCAKAQTTQIFPYDCFRPQRSIYDLLESEAEISVPSDRRFYPFRCTFDIECFMKPVTRNDLDTEKLSYSTEHVLMSVSIHSNVPGFDRPTCFVRNGDSEQQLVDDFVQYLLKISRQAYELLLKENSDIIAALDKKIEDHELIEKAFRSEKMSSPRLYASRGLGKLKENFLAHLAELPVLGFNSQRYDINVIHGPLIKSLLSHDKITFTVKRENRFQCIKTRHLKFLDIMNYIAPGFTYEKFIKAYGCKQQKGFFPYEYVDSIEKLEETSLPPHEAFYSTLRQTNISANDYAFCIDVWEKNKMSSLRDFLVWYNNLDVTPFLEAVEKQFQVYREKKIDMFKDAISVPGLSVRWLFNESEGEEFSIPLISKKNADLYKTIRANIVGGPSIVFHRYHEADKTVLRQHDFQSDGKLCAQVLGFDANALYLWATMQELPTGFLVRRRKDKKFYPELSDTFGRQALEWLQWLAHKHRVFIEHKFNVGEKRVGAHGIPVDGYHKPSRTVFQFHGCIFHGCPFSNCKLTKGMKVNPRTNESLFSLRYKTIRNEHYLRAFGLNLITVQECEWMQTKDKDPECKQFVKDFFDQKMAERKTMTEEQILRAIAEDKIFGLVECDIFVPSHLQAQFAEMPPIFKNILVSRNDLPDHMRTHAEEYGHLSQPQQMLVGSFFGKKVLVLTSLLKWYMAKGLQISQVYQVAQFTAMTPFKKFGESVCMARREGDASPDKAVIADTAKLIGNSLYGKTITNKERHTNIQYTTSVEKAQRLVMAKNYMALTELSDDVFQIESSKKNIKLDIPIVIGFSILQLAKLRMLSFKYDFMDRFFDQRDFQYCCMDTDSAYVAFSGKFEDLVHTSLRREFYETYQEWFPAPFCSGHKAAFMSTKLNRKEWQLAAECCKKQYNFDKRTPGLFKLEFEGRGIVALNSKTYFCIADHGYKMSSKGINKAQNAFTFQQFLTVLKTKDSISGMNRGFRRRDNSMLTYYQIKTGLSYFYAKRRVSADGVTTFPLLR